MGILWNLVRTGPIAITVVAAAELSKRYPRSGALPLSLPIVSVLAFIVTWLQHRDPVVISRSSKRP